MPGFFVTLVAMPLTLALVPRTLGTARVRTVHVIRIWLYSLMLPLTIGVAWAVFQGLLNGLGLRDLARHLVEPAARGRDSQLGLVLSHAQIVLSGAIVGTDFLTGSWGPPECRARTI